MDLVQLNNVSELPDQWDELAGQYFQRREFLAHCEARNPCRQRYYLAREDGRLVAGAILYSLRLSLLTFARLNLPVMMQIVGIPCSVSCSGLIGQPDQTRALLGNLKKREKGLLLALNLGSENQVPHGVAAARTLPTLTLEHSFSTWDEYLTTIRSDYRRRIKNIETRSQKLRFRPQSCSGFSREHHDLYLQVLEKSDAKLEKLSLNFFRDLPGGFQMISAEREGRLAGWAITLNAPEGFYFFLGGVDRAENIAHAVYLRLLVEVVRQGIELGSRHIDLGQTAEIPKMRLGGECHPLYLGATHSNPIVRPILRGASGILGYRRRVPGHRVFGASQ